MRKFLCFVMGIIVSMALCRSTAMAASVTIHSGEALGVNNLSENEYVSDIVENGGKLYFMVMDMETGYQTKIICSAVDDEDNVGVYTPEMAGGTAQQYFISMEPAISGGMWFHLEDNPGLDADRRVVLFQNGQMTAQQQCTGRAKLCAEGAIWKEGTEFISWDGLNLKRFPIPASADNINQFVLWNGLPCFVDYASKSVLAYQTDGQIEPVYTLPEGNCTTCLASCGGEAYLSHCTGDGVSPLTANRALIRLSDGKQIGDNYYNIQQLRFQMDGTIQMAVIDGATNITGYTQISIDQDSVTEREIGEYLVTADKMIPETGEDGLPSGWRYADSVGNQWIYSGGIGVEKGTAAVTKVTRDGTTVNYTAEALSGFALYYKGAGVSFDVEPYITDTGFTMVPVRGVAYLLNADITWDGETRTVTVKQANHTVLLAIDSLTALVDGTEVPLGAPAVIVGGRTMLPLRFLTETLGGTIRWESGAVYLE